MIMVWMHVMIMLRMGIVMMLKILKLTWLIVLSKLLDIKFSLT